ncbi:MAG TPA: hypothetical protein VFV85_03875, partial [Conexibacter sp.]|nr:hypothetical protein [Conexibacter sp.]
MASAASEAAIAAPRGSARATARSANDAATAAWLAAIPCAALAAVAVLLLGPPLARLMAPVPGQFTFLQEELPFIRPEPTEHARYLLALGAPLLGALATVLGPRWQPRVPARAAAALVQATQAALVALVAAALVAQRRFAFGPVYKGGEERPFHLSYFTNATFAVAALLAAATVATLWSERLRTRAAALLRESRARRLIALAVALAATIAWVLPALQTDASIAMAPEDLLYHLAFPLDETFAVLNGRTPLVNFTAQYSSLWPFVLALPMAALGKTLLTFTSAIAALDALALLAVFGVLRRVTRSSLAALLLYLPFLASSLFLIGGTLSNRSTVGTYVGTFPLRYAGPWLVAWLVARLLARREPPTSRASWLLFTAAGLALLNNGDFGVATVGASAAALLWTAAPLTRRALLRLAGAVTAGLATALALVALLTLARTGELPQPERLVDYARLYTISGYALEPIPGVLGTHLLVYLTYVAAIVVATVRALRGAANRALTGMLAWAGIFGLGAGTYYVGRSHPVALKHQFSAWSFALALLTVVAAGALASARGRRHALAAVAVLFGFGVMACSVAQLPTPWSQVRRLRAPYLQLAEWRSPRLFVPPAAPAARAFVASLADGPHRFAYRRGAPVAILLTGGHRVADAYGVADVSPYTGIESLQT